MCNLILIDGDAFYLDDFIITDFYIRKFDECWAGEGGRLFDANRRKKPKYVPDRN